MIKNNQSAIEADQAEYKQINKDLRFVIIMNLTFFILLMALYFFNRSTGKVDTFFAHLLKF